MMSLGLQDFAALIAALSMVPSIGLAVCRCRCILQAATDNTSRRLVRYEANAATRLCSPLDIERAARWLE